MWNPALVLQLLLTIVLIACPVHCTFAWAEGDPCCGSELATYSPGETCSPGEETPCCEGTDTSRVEPSTLDAGDDSTPSGRSSASACQCLCGGATLTSPTSAPADDLAAVESGLLPDVDAATTLASAHSRENSPPPAQRSGRMIRCWIMSLRN